MRDTQPESAEAKLRRQFPALYITLVSIVIALAIEGLLGRLGELESLGVGAARAVLFAQVGVVLLIASLLWWVSARWVTTIPWPFGFSDGFSMIALLIVFHIVTRSIANDFGHWLLSLGVFGLATSFVYLLNGQRGLRVNGHSGSVRRRHGVAGAAVGAIGLVCTLLAAVGGGAWAPPGQLVLALGIGVATIAFAYLDYRVWRLACAEPERADA